MEPAGTPPTRPPHCLLSLQCSLHFVKETTRGLFWLISFTKHRYSEIYPYRCVREFFIHFYS